MKRVMMFALLIALVLGGTRGAVADPVRQYFTSAANVTIQ